MDLDGDEIAGVVDLFGGLDRAELETALVELAFRRGDAADDAAVEAAVDAAVADFSLVSVDGLLVSGPAALPAAPPGADDLPHILEVERRTVDREAAAAAAEARFRDAADAALGAGDGERLRHLLEVSYDLEAWGSVDVSDAREAIDRALDAES